MQHSPKHAESNYFFSKQQWECDFMSPIMDGVTSLSMAETIKPIVTH
uniref:Uncharacterized protein n=1 Tax=Anguilla anguilla TaxID=7936 RepID=A0A0E9QQZ7_ANGAN